MSKLSKFIQSNKETLYAFATQNTPRNKDGRAVIPKGDEWRDETVWDSMIEENKEQ